MIGFAAKRTQGAADWMIVHWTEKDISLSVREQKADICQKSRKKSG